MKLVVNQEREVAPLDGDAIEATLRGLEVDDFAVLARDDDTYIQLMRTEDAEWICEYQAGSTDEHYGLDPPPTELEPLIAAFRAYLASDDQGWLGAFDWQRMALD